MITFTAQTTAIEVHSGLLFQPGGDAHRWCAGLAREMETWAHIFAPPKRSAAKLGTWSRGALQASIYRNLTGGGPAGNIIEINVGARVPYAKYVHEGTANQGRRYIYTTLGYANKGIVDSWIDGRFFEGSNADRGFWMPITRIPGKTGFTLRVRGQKANPFITDAYSRTAYDHPALPKQRFKRTFID